MSALGLPSRSKENVVIHSPAGATLVPIADLTAGFGAVRLQEGRDEGWIAVVPDAPWEPSVSRSVVVINVAEGSARLVQGPSIPDVALGMYCDSAHEGYVASDGSVLFSSFEADGLRVLRYPISGGAPEIIGKPLTKIALLNVAERSNGFVVLGSDGSDTYCGSGTDWPGPASPSAAAGDSVYAGRIGASAPLRELEFGGTWWRHELDSTGSCVIGPKDAEEFAQGAQYRVDDLAHGTTFEPAPGDREIAWIE